MFPGFSYFLNHWDPALSRNPLNYFLFMFPKFSSFLLNHWDPVLPRNHPNYFLFMFPGFSSLLNHWDPVLSRNPLFVFPGFSYLPNHWDPVLSRNPLHYFLFMFPGVSSSLLNHWDLVLSKKSFIQYFVYVSRIFSLPSESLGSRSVEESSKLFSDIFPGFSSYLLNHWDPVLPRNPLYYFLFMFLGFSSLLNHWDPDP
jgi:hypothetical protein